MEERAYPVDVIAMYSANGDIRPLRLRLEDESHMLIRVDIQEVISIKAIEYVGVEAHIFLCRARLHGQDRLLELKYTFRTHTWRLLGKR